MGDAVAWMENRVNGHGKDSRQSGRYFSKNELDRVRYMGTNFSGRICFSSYCRVKTYSEKVAQGLLEKKVREVLLAASEIAPVAKP